MHDLEVREVNLRACQVLREHLDDRGAIIRIVDALDVVGQVDDVGFFDRRDRLYFEVDFYYSGHGVGLFDQFGDLFAVTILEEAEEVVLVD